jgi:hypothetical protein
MVCDSAFGLVNDSSYPPPHRHDRIIRYMCQDCGALVVHDTYKHTWDVLNFKRKWVKT